LENSSAWGFQVAKTGFVLSMAVNILMTGLIVFRILKVFLEVKAATTSVELTLGTTGGTKLRHVIFIIIESGMALFAVQLVCFVLNYLGRDQSDAVFLAYDLFIGIHQMFNVVTKSVHFCFFCLLMTFTWLGHHTNNNFSAGLNEIVLR
jgi:hypothetical protein